MKKTDKPAIPPKPACRDCRFFHKLKRDDMEQGVAYPSQGECRRYPPQVLALRGEGRRQLAVTKWPTINSAEWCGGFVHVLGKPPQDDKPVAGFKTNGK